MLAFGLPLLVDFICTADRKPPPPLLNWMIASCTACGLMLFVACLVPFVIAIDPLHVFAQIFLVGGIIGAMVDYPLLWYRKFKLKYNLRRFTLEIVALILLAGTFLGLLLLFQANYKPTALSI